MRKEKGTITLYVLIACLFFVFILSITYVSNLNKLQIQEQEVKQIQDNYFRIVENADEIYENLITNAQVKGIFASLNGNILSFFDNEEAARANADSDAHYYGNLSGQSYSSGSKVPWYSERANIKTVNFVDEILPVSTSYWFEECSNLNKFENMVNLNTSKVKSMRHMFYGCENLTNIDLNNFNTSNVTLMDGMFQNCLKLVSIDVSKFDTSKVTDMTAMFSGNYSSEANMSLTEIKGLENFDTSNVTCMWDMFLRCTQLTQINVTNFNTEKVTNMQGMFFLCEKLTSLDLAKFNTSNSTNMALMFYGTINLKSIDVSSFDTSKVTTMESMFSMSSYENVAKLTEIKGLENFDTSNVTSMWDMFLNCSSLTSLNVSNFNTSKVTNMQGMFCKCSNLTTLDLSSFNTKNAINMTQMFTNDIKLATIYVGTNWSVTQADTGYMFYNCGTSSVTFK